jgi:hypothetical protein
MEIRTNGTRFKNYNKWEIIRQASYDYENEGLLNKIMSEPIVNTTNPLLKLLLDFVETSLVFVMKYTDVLKNFKNPHWKNR